MSGHHNIRIYTKGDNPWCETCINSEHIIGESIFKPGAHVCLAAAVPTMGKCSAYGKETNKQAYARGHGVSVVE